MHRDITVFRDDYEQGRHQSVKQATKRDFHLRLHWQRASMGLSVALGSHKRWDTALEQEVCAWSRAGRVSIDALPRNNSQLWRLSRGDLLDFFGNYALHRGL